MQIFFVAGLQTFPRGPQDAAHQSPAPTVKNPLHASDPSARIHRLPSAVDTLPAVPRQCPSMFQTVPPSLGLLFPSWPRGTGTERTSHRFVKSITKSSALFSGLGSTAVMARTRLPRLSFMQVKNSCSLFFMRTKYAALLVLSSPSCCLEIVCICIRALRALLLLCGDIEENAGSTARSITTQTTNAVMSVLREIQSAQASILNEMKSIRFTLLQHEENLKKLLKDTKIEDECSVIATVKEKVDGLESPSMQNCGDITRLVARMDGSEERQRRSKLVFCDF
ncbi:hypothetical protein HPB48_019349 [Haemaphysalis longicornis]|uniref:Uncharacterized protein n=1 Tax=Haemaphysalis longicornis TaxID=44386 RepID=A0A9J6G6Q8_HAELO|nr:hypothetical protein HPB48_019349 [Haemaphysalis longicornis]